MVARFYKKLNNHKIILIIQDKVITKMNHISIPTKASWNLEENPNLVKV